MSKLEELIQQLCPDGVEYKRLGDVLTIKNGRDYKSFESGSVPVYGSGGIMAYINTAVYDKPSVLIPRKGSLEKLYYVDKPFWNVDTIFYTEINTELVCPKFVYYWLAKQHLERLNKAGGVPSLTQAVLNKITIPVPPLEIQREIVRILDNFTELTARKKQYEYYQEKLLYVGQDTNIKWKKIGELCTFRRGSFPQPYGNKEWYDGEGAMPFVQVADIGDNMQLVKSTKRKISVLAQPKSVFAPKGSIIISLQGSIGRIAITQYDAYIDRTVAIFQALSNEVVSKYFVYQLQRVFAIKAKKARGSTIKTITKEEFTEFLIPIMPLNEQRRIVSILDRFDALCNDLVGGLPAEIEARQKQYEYYRDKLLTFQDA